jgi:hypothetical protein
MASDTEDIAPESTPSRDGKQAIKSLNELRRNLQSITAEKPPDLARQVCFSEVMDIFSNPKLALPVNLFQLHQTEFCFDQESSELPLSGQRFG